MNQNTALFLVLALPTLAPPAHAQCSVERLLDESVAKNDELGTAVALDGNIALVGSQDTTLFFTNGSVTVFERTSSGYQRVQKLFSGVEYASNFGFTLDVEGDVALVGAPGDNFQPGYAFVFERRPVGWVRTAILAPSDGVNDWDFGLSLAVSGDTLIVGSPAENGQIPSSGAAYVYERTGLGWEQTAKLFSTEPANNEGFGIALGFEDDLVLVGAELAHGFALDTGAVYQFERTGTTWAETDKVISAQATPFSRFGNAVALDSGTLLVGADGANNSVGTAFVFERSGTSWIQTAQLTGASTFSGSLFGETVALSGDHAVVGAPSFAFPGGAYLFERTGTVWIETELVNPESVPTDRFGAGVAVQQGCALVGAPGDVLGEAYTFSTSDDFDTLLPDGATLSLAQGGTQGLLVNGCLSFTDQLYWVLGSATGTAGVPFGAFQLPLTLDGYFLLTLTSPGSPPLGTTLGLLDQQAKAAASFTLPPGIDPGLAGVTLRHAFGVLDRHTFEPLFASNAVALVLVP